MPLRLTDEQVAAVDLFCTGANLRIFAFAGAGKTATLGIMADEAQGRSLYLAFNRSIAVEARSRFPEWTRCSTIHGLAYQAMRRSFGDDKLVGQLGAAEVVELLELRDRPFGRARLTARAQAEVVRGTLDRFLHGSNAQPAASDVPLTGMLARAPLADAADVVERAVAGARMLWAEMADPCNPVPLGHDGYLKLWSMQSPRLEADAIFLDEAQDSNAVVLDILRAQDAQIVYVGDPHQQIYAWRGAVDAMAAMPAAYEAHLTASFRFGGAIADAASQVVATLGETRRLRGNPAIDSRIGACAPDAVIARTNAGVVDAVLDALTIAERPHVVGGTGELMRLLLGVEALRRGRTPSAPDLFGFADWDEVIDAASTPGGASLATLVSLVEQYGEDRLIASLAKVVDDEARADVTIATAHRAKGREWSKVQLRDDFGRSGPDDRPDPAETRLFYVALTRAKLAVDVAPGLLSRFTDACPTQAAA